MSDNYGREISPEDLEQIRSKLQATEASATASMQQSLQELLNQVDRVIAEMFEALDTGKQGFVELASFLDSYHHLSN